MIGGLIGMCQSEWVRRIHGSYTANVPPLLTNGSVFSDCIMSKPW